MKTQRRPDTNHHYRIYTKNTIGSARGIAGITCLALFLMLPLFCIPDVNAEVDWGKVGAKDIKVFYAGVASWEFLKGEDHGTGADVVNKMKVTCQECHISKDGKYDIRADQIISGELKKLKSGGPLEPEPITGMPGFKDVTIQAAYDAENIYLRLQWQGSGASVADPSLKEAGRADRVSIQVANKIRSFRIYGCLMVCHDDQTDMPGNTGAEVKLYGYYARKKGEVVAQDKLDEFLEKGQFVDLWEIFFVGNEVTTADQHILESRFEDKNDLSATGSFEGGKYTVIITRKLGTGDKGDVVLQDGEDFNISVGIHDNKNKGRKHYTSFSVSVGLGTAADITALKL